MSAPVDVQDNPSDASGLILKDRIESLQIVNKEIGTVRLKLNWAQLDMLGHVERQLATTGKIRIIVLKARQIGISTFTEALAFTLAMMIMNYRVLIVSHERDASENILGMTKTYWEHYRFRQLLHVHSDSRYESSWKETGSSIKVATAGKKGSAGVGRSKTTHFQHITEIAFWTDVENTMLSLNQTLPEVPMSACVIESTANGVGNWYHSEWEKAVAGETDYLPLFYPWWKHPEYRASHLRLPIKPLGKLSVEEAFYRKYLNVDDDRLTWRRWYIANKCNGDVLQFMQEYPATPEEAFINTGLNVFPKSQLQKIYDPMKGWRGALHREPGSNNIEFTLEPEGDLKIFSLPGANREKYQYVVAGDPTRTMYGDYACIQVLDRRTLEQVAVFRKKMDPVDFAEELYRIGVFYNDALVTCECEGGGYGTIAALLTLGYPNLARKTDPSLGRKSVSASRYGWNTNVQTKNLAMGWMKNVIYKGIPTFHDEHTYKEFMNYVTKPNGEFGPADEKNGHDDTVMSYVIAVVTHILDGPLDPYTGASALEGLSPDRMHGAVNLNAEDPEGPDWMNWSPTHE